MKGILRQTSIETHDLTAEVTVKISVDDVHRMIHSLVSEPCRMVLTSEGWMCEWLGGVRRVGL